MCSQKREYMHFLLQITCYDLSEDNFLVVGKTNFIYL